MENATKALIIAGSVLVAVLIIAMMMKTFNSTTGLQEEQQRSMASTEANMFNNTFSGYLGYEISKSKARALVQKIITSNATSDKKVNFNGSAPNISNAEAGIYEPEYDSYGYIVNIKKRP